MNCEETRELITGLVDDELSAEEHDLLAAHLRDCRICQEARQAESALKQNLRSVTEAVIAPAELRESILAARARRARIGNVAAGSSMLTRLRVSALRPAFAAALVILIFVPLFLLLGPKEEIAPALMAAHREIATDEKYKSMNPVQDMSSLKTKLVAAVDGRFEPMGFDLSMMGLLPVSGFVRKIDGRDVIVTVYQGRGPEITCFTFLGRESDAPKKAQVIHDTVKNIDFYSFSGGGINGVLHREGDVICVMLSAMPAGDLLALVRAKARHA